MADATNIEDLEKKELFSDMKEPPVLYFTNKPFAEALDPRVLQVWKNQSPHEQRSPGWYVDRGKCITASSIASALMKTEEACRYYIEHFNLQDSFEINPKKNCSYKDSQLDLIMGKCGLGDGFKGNEFTLWGQKYEPVVSNIYSQMKQVDMLEFNLCFHPTIPFLAASPDGISTDGVMLEIKCPPIRPVKPYPPIYYFQQILMQLECTNLDFCDYFDCHFIEYIDTDGWKQDALCWEETNCIKEKLGEPRVEHHLYGIILSYQDGSDDDGKAILKNIYPPPTVVTVDQFLQWADGTVQEYESDGIDLIFTYYKLHQYYLARVKANPQWVQDNLPTMQEVWDRIQLGRTPEGHAVLAKIKQDKVDKREERKIKKKEDDLASVFLSLDISGADPPPARSKRPVYVHEDCLFD